MPTASRNERKKRRTRRNLSLATRELRALNARHINAQFTVLAILQSFGGSVVVNAEDATAVMTGFTHLGWTGERQEDGSMKVTLTDTRPAVTPVAPAVSGASSDPMVALGPRSVTAQLAAERRAEDSV